MGKGKRITAVFLACCLCFCVSACREAGGGGPQEQQTNGESALIVYCDNLRNFEYTDKIVNQFNRKSKTTKVSVKYIIDGAYEETVNAMLSAGDASVDCFSISQAGKSNELATAGMLAELGEYVRTTQLNVANYGSAIDVVRLDEQLYSLPISKNSWMLFYNKDYFDRMGEPYPGQMTWDEYADLAKKLTYREKYKICWGGFIPPWTMNLGAAAAEEYLTDDELPITRRYLELLNRVYNVDKSHPDIITMRRDYGEPYDLVENGQVAMMINADWAIPRLLSDAQQKPLGFEWDIAPLPVFEFLEEGTTVGNCSYLGISAFSEHPRNAFEFAAYLCGEEGAMIMAENSVCPAYLVDGSTEAYLENANVPGAKYFFESNTLNLENAHPLYEAIHEKFDHEMNFYLLGLKDLDEAFADYDESRKELLRGPA